MCAGSKLRGGLYWSLLYTGALQIQACGANFRTFATNYAVYYYEALRDLL